MNSFKMFMEENRPTVDRRIAAIFNNISDENDDPIIKRMKSVMEEFCLRDGKRVRPLLALLGYEIFKGKKKSSMLTVASVLELIHAFLLIHDDIMDMSEKRREKKTVHKIYEEYYKKTELNGEHMAMLGGDTLCFIAYQALFTTSFSQKKKNEALKAVTDLLVRTCYGQALDYEMQAYPLSEERILEMYRLKTSIYTISGPLGIGALLGGAERKDLLLLKKFARPLGIAFQIQDDLLDVFPTGENTGKARYGDFKEGKYTLLVYYAFEYGTDADKKFLRNNLGNEKLTKKDAEKICNIIEKTGSRKYATDMIERLYAESKKVIESSHFKSKDRMKLLDLLDYVMKRKR